MIGFLRPTLHIWKSYRLPDFYFSFQIFAMVSLIVIILSVATFCMESIEKLKQNYKGLFEGMEYFYLVWFSADFLARLLTCPSLVTFFKTFMTWVDIASVIPLYVNLAIGDKETSVSGTLNFLFVLRLIRIFRLFRFFRTMSGMQVIGHTLRASARELFLLILILLIPMVIFSTLVFYAEKVRNWVLVFCAIKAPEQYICVELCIRFFKGRSGLFKQPLANTIVTIIII